MAANIETMFSASRITPWHGLGTVIDEAPTSKEALKLAGLDWEVQPFPLYTGMDKNKLKLEAIPNMMANIRTSDGKIMGHVTGKYKLVQNTEAFDFTDALLGEGVKYETAGSLQSGKVWMLAKLPETEIVNEKHEQYLVFSNSFDGKGSIRVVMTDVRVVCQNTLSLALKGAKRSWSLVHMGNMDQKLEEARRTLDLSIKYNEMFKQEALHLVESKVSEQDFENFIGKFIPFNDEMSKLQIERAKEKQERFKEIYFNAPDLSLIRGTKWGVLQAASDFVTHTPSYRSTDTYQENLFDSFMTGNVLLDSAYDLLKAA